MIRKKLLTNNVLIMAITAAITMTGIIHINANNNTIIKPDKLEITTVTHKELTPVIKGDITINEEQNVINGIVNKKKAIVNKDSWVASIKAVKKALADSGRTYSQIGYISADFNTDKGTKTLCIRTDCSGMVSAALALYSGDAGVNGKCSYETKPYLEQCDNYKGNTAKEVLSHFNYHTFTNWDDLQEGDILLYYGHIDIFSYIDNGIPYKWNAGYTEALQSAEATPSTRIPYGYMRLEGTTSFSVIEQVGLEDIVESANKESASIESICPNKKEEVVENIQEEAIPTEIDENNTETQVLDESQVEEIVDAAEDNVECESDSSLISDTPTTDSVIEDITYNDYIFTGTWNENKFTGSSDNLTLEYYSETLDISQYEKIEESDIGFITTTGNIYTAIIINDSGTYAISSGSYEAIKEFIYK